MRTRVRPRINFFDRSEFFKAVEIGWADRGAESSFVDNVHVTLWHTDEREAAGVEDSWGVSMTASWLFDDDRLMPFVRAGWADGDAALADRSVTLGVAGNVTERSDLIGFAVNWSRPSTSSDDQYVAELFYRLQLAQNLAITPSVQLVVDPALNPDEDVVGVFGLRARVTF